MKGSPSSTVRDTVSQNTSESPVTETHGLLALPWSTWIHAAKPMASGALHAVAVPLLTVHWASALPAARTTPAMAIRAATNFMMPPCGCGPDLKWSPGREVVSVVSSESSGSSRTHFTCSVPTALVGPVVFREGCGGRHLARPVRVLTPSLALLPGALRPPPAQAVTGAGAFPGVARLPSDAARSRSAAFATSCSRFALCSIFNQRALFLVAVRAA